MNAWKNNDYDRIAEALSYIQNNLKTQPGWEEGEKANPGTIRFQRPSTDQEEINPEKFLQYITVHHIQKVLKENKVTLFESNYEADISGLGQLHDRFIKLEGMTPDEYKNGSKSISVHYSVAGSPFGKILVASTEKGICHLAFAENEQEAIRELQTKFPNAARRQTVDPVQQNALCIFSRDWSQLQPIKLHVKGTKFQMQVWETLLKIPAGQLSTYGSIAKKINLPYACRAVGSAIGDNPVAYLIPCHRVVQSTGALGGYRWGTVRKAAMIGWEAALANNPNS